MVYPIPASSGSITDGGLGVLPEDTTQTSWKIGSCSSGVAGSIYTFRGTDTSSVVATLGYGPLVDATIYHLLHSGGKTVYAYKATTSTAGSNSAVTAVGTSPAVTLTGAPYNQAQGKIVIVAGGVIGTSTFKYSTDGGDTYSDEIATAATYLIAELGVTLNFAAGTYVSGDSYTWTSTAPGMTTTNIGNAMDAIIASPLEAGFVHLVGVPADASATVAITALLQTKIEAALAAKKYLFAIHGSAAVDKALLIAAATSVSAKYVMACAGFLELANDRTGKIEKRPSDFVIAARVARNPISVDLARDVADTVLDPVARVSTLVPPGAVAADGYHDEAATPGLNQARFATLMTFTGRAGAYITNGAMMAPSGSDFGLVQFVRIAMRSAQLFYLWSLDNLSQRIRKDPSTGYILPAVANALEDDATTFLRAGVGQHVDGISVVINRSDNLSADPTLRYKIRLVGPAYAKEIDWELGLVASLPE